MTAPAAPPVPDYATLDRRLREVLAAAGPADWSRPSPCDDWDAAQVVAHLVGTQRDFLSAHTTLGPDPATDTDPATAWALHADQVEAAIADPGLLATRYDGYFGPTTVGATLSTFYLVDLIVHRWDVARALGRDTTFGEDELSFLESTVPSWGPALRMPGICGPAVEVPPGSDRQTTVLGFLGRTV